MRNYEEKTSILKENIDRVIYAELTFSNSKHTAEKNHKSDEKVIIMNIRAEKLYIVSCSKEETVYFTPPLCIHIDAIDEFFFIAESGKQQMKECK